MARRLIGIDHDGDTLHIAVLLEDKGRTRLLRVGHILLEEGGVAAAVAQFAGGELQTGDRLCATLPGSSGWVRNLVFPFSERKALLSALPLALVAQLPLPLEECVWASQEPLADAGGAMVLTAAVRRETAITVLAPFDAANLPLQTLDLAPYAIAAGVHPLLPGAGILAVVGKAETTLIRLGEDRADGYRLIPHGNDGNVQTLIVAAARALRGGKSAADAPLLLAGSAVDEALLTALRSEIDGVELARVILDGQPVSPQELPAVAIALRGADRSPGAGFNFRHGALAHRGAWAPQRRRLIAAALLLGASLLIFAGTSLTSYLHKSRQAEALQLELTRRYRELIPGSGSVVDPLLQLQSRMLEMERSAHPGGSARAEAPLAVLRELSRLTPADLSVDLRDLTWSPEEMRIEGTTSTFDAANRLVRSLQQSPLLAAVRLTDAKANADGARVSFRLTLPLGTKTEVPR